MAAMKLAIIVIVIVAVVVLLPLAIASFKTARGELNGDQRRELKELRATVRKIEILSAQNKDVNPELAAQIDDEIYNYKTKETS